MNGATDLFLVCSDRLKAGQLTSARISLRLCIYRTDSSPLPERDAQPRRIGLAVRTTAQGISRELGARQAIGLG